MPPKQMPVRFLKPAENEVPVPAQPRPTLAPREVLRVFEEFVRRDQRKPARRKSA